MNTPTDRFLTGSSTGSFSTQSQHRFPVPSPTGTGTGATGSSTGTEPVEPLDPNPVNHHPKEHPVNSTPQTEAGHYLASKDYVTQTATTLCGITEPLASIPAEGEPFEPGRLACAECFGRVVRLTEGFTAESHNRLADVVEDLLLRGRRDWTGLADQLDAATLRIEKLERKLSKRGQR